MNRSRTVHDVEWTWQDVPYFSSLQHEDIAQGQGLLGMTHPLMLMITCAKCGKNPSRTLRVVKQTWQDVPYLAVLLCHLQQFYYKVMAQWPWRYMSRAKVFVCDTPSHASDHLCPIWKDSLKNCTCCRADTKECHILSFYCKVMAEWPWRNRSRSKVIACDTPSPANEHFCQIWKESI